MDYVLPLRRDWHLNAHPEAMDYVLPLRMDLLSQNS